MGCCLPSSAHASSGTSLFHQKRRPALARSGGRPDLHRRFRRPGWPPRRSARAETPDRDARERSPGGAQAQPLTAARGAGGAFLGVPWVPWMGAGAIVLFPPEDKRSARVPLHDSPQSAGGPPERAARVVVFWWKRDKVLRSPTTSCLVLARRAALACRGCWVNSGQDRIKSLFAGIFIRNPPRQMSASVM
jgi:hypothetical protein